MHICKMSERIKLIFFGIKQLRFDIKHFIFMLSSGILVERIKTSKLRSLSRGVIYSGERTIPSSSGVKEFKEINVLRCVGESII